jgi:hypothetical protein
MIRNPFQIFLIVAVSVLIWSCGSNQQTTDNKEVELLRKENELSKKEAELAKKELEISQSNTANTNTSPLPPKVANIKIVGVKFNKGHHTIPQIAAPRTPQDQEFNAFVRKLITADFSGYDVSYAIPEFVSLYLYEEFCGASCHVGITPVNFDLETGKPLENLSELFKPRSDFLRTTASYCVRELRRTWTCDDDETFNSGSSPTSDNYKIWRVSRKGVEITFQQYQLGPGACGGTSVVVPYSLLRGMLREDVGWFRSL